MNASDNPQANKFGAVHVSGPLQGDGPLCASSPGAVPAVITPGATPTVDWSKGNLFSLTPGEDETISFINPSVGQTITIVVTTSGATSRTLTFGGKSTGTLATGTASGKIFITRFTYDGTNTIEVGRTAAQ